MTANLRPAIAAALEALGAGDQREATAILLGAIESDGSPDLPYRCECGDRFQWPGQLAEHRLFWHDEAEGRAA